MKKVTKNSKNDVEQKNIQNMQKKIRDQAKRLCSMQEYINSLEATIKDNQSNNSLLNQQSYNDLNKKFNDLQQKYNTLFFNTQINSSSASNNNEELNKDDLIIRLKNENSELKSKIKKEINKNREQKKQMEFLNQNLETEIVKRGLRGCLDYLTEKLTNTNNIGEEEEDSYLKILYEINKIKEENKQLLKEKNKNLTKIENLEKIDDNYQKNIDIINKLNNENNNLYSQNEMLQNELQVVKNNLMQSEKNLFELKGQHFGIIRENETLKINNNNLDDLKRENENLLNALNDLEIKVNRLTNENNSLSDYKLGYDLVLKENNELKKINESLSYDNALFEQDVYFLKTNLDKLVDVGQNNILLKNELDELKNLLNNLKNRKQVNNVFERISELEERNKNLELLLNEKENDKNKKKDKENTKNKNNNNNNNKDYINNIINNYNNKKENKYKCESRNSNNSINSRNSRNSIDNKYIMAINYYADLLLRVLKYHLKDNSNVKNILFQLLDLNHKKIGLIQEIEKLTNHNDNNNNNKNKKNSKEDSNKKKNEIKKKDKEKELDNLIATINYFDKELKEFEPK